MGPDAEAQEAETRTIALLGMRFESQQMLDDGTGMQADGCSPVDKTFRQSLGGREMGFRHVPAHRRVTLT
jgi:hypothetical protein